MSDTASGELLGPFEVFWPGAVAGMVAVLVLSFVLHQYRTSIVEWLSLSRQRTVVFRFALLIVVPFFSAVLGDLVNFSEAIEGKGKTGDQVLLFFLSPLGALWLAAHWLDQCLSDDWQAQLSTARTELAQALRGKAKAEEQRNYPIRLGSIMLRIVSFKGKRVREVLPEMSSISDSSGHLDAIRRAFDPDAQVLKTLIGIQSFFQDRVGADGEGHPYASRVALFEERGDHLEPVVSFDGTSEDAIVAPLGAHREKFRLSPTHNKNCSASVALRSGKTIVIPDADAAHGDITEPFEHFDDQQQSQIKSLVAMPLHRDDRYDACTYVLSIDTNRANYFGSSGIDERQLELLRQNLAQRILFEEDVKRLLTPRE